ncbi:DnaJ domain-containing protein [Pseudomaricurvus alcaniphilus]|uniref:DnaJ domain-containing protein n=1 Tax=Pseudomaricurvus alcaniphilus TaxID=1166482 RepID=UPI0014088F14|nr:DnaJ domain-containing protein [Pseudomaricurvus alcaniphilus]
MVKPTRLSYNGANFNRGHYHVIVRVVLLALAVFFLLNLVSYIERQPPQQRKALLWKYSGYAILALAIILVATGRLHWIGAAIAALIPLVRTFGGLAMRYAPLRDWLKKQPFANPVLTGRFIKIVVSAASGDIQGEVIAGKHQGASLESLSEAQLQELLSDYQQQDIKSARLLAVYMHRRFRKHYSQEQQTQDSGGGAMTRSEALQVLGLSDTAEKQDIIKAHRKLMQKVHPDHGGSDYLAAKINQAKDFLLKA